MWINAQVPCICIFWLWVICFVIFVFLGSNPSHVCKQKNGLVVFVGVGGGRVLSIFVRRSGAHFVLAKLVGIWCE